MWNFSKNSLDENALEAPPSNHTFDEQEMSMEMYNDEYDNYNKVPNSGGHDSEAYLKAALREHQRGNNLNSPRHSGKHNGTVNGAMLPSAYDNVGFQPPHNTDDLEATEI